MINITLKVSFNSSKETLRPSLLKMLDVLVYANQMHLASKPETPLLYDAGVIYEREDWGKEQWLTIPYVLENKKGDCEDLVGWRVAELRSVKKEFAKPDLIRKGTLWHVVVRRANGKIEDPSLMLGM